MNHEQLLSPEEQKLRKRWLFWNVKIPIVAAVLVTISYAIPLFTEFNPSALLMVLGMAAMMGGLIYLSYYCAYKKPGTIFLTLILIFTPILVILDAISTASNTIPENGVELFVMLMVWTLSTAYDILIFYLSLKLRTINKKVRTMLLTPDKKANPA